MSSGPTCSVFLFYYTQHVCSFSQTSHFSHQVLDITSSLAGVQSKNEENSDVQWLLTYGGKSFLEISACTDSPVFLWLQMNHNHLPSPILGIGGQDAYDHHKPIIIHPYRARVIASWTNLLTRKMQEIGWWKGKQYNLLNQIYKCNFTFM